MRIILVFILSFLSGAVFANAEAEAHLSKMLEKYNSLSVYEDNGTSRTKFIRPDGSSFIDDLKFTTSFIENESLYFKWVEQPNELLKRIGGKLAEPKTYIVWKNKSGIFSEFNNEEEQYTKLSTALSSATGISSSLAWMTPRYLSPEIPCKPSLGAEASEIVSSDGDTIIIKQIHSRGGISKLYIDKATYLISKYEMFRELYNGSKTEQVAVFNIVEAK